MFEFLAPILWDRWFLILYRALGTIGLLYLVFWLLKPKFLQQYRIPQLKNAKLLTLPEVLNSFVGLTVYLIPIAFIAIAKVKYNYTVIYTDISQYGLAYFFISILIYIVVFDTAFYWSHRLMHKVPFFKRSHAIHHKSVNITPLTAYSFHIVEALLDMSPYIFLTLLVPIHPLALIIFSIFGLLQNSYIHLGYDFGYEFRTKHPILKWINSSTHHSTHHQLYEGNYGNYFTFWDKMMGTEVEHPVIVANKKPE